MLHCHEENGTMDQMGWLKSEQAKLILRHVCLIELPTGSCRFMYDQHVCQGWHKVSIIHIVVIMLPITIPLRKTNKTSLVSSWKDTREVSKPYFTLASLKHQIGTIYIIIIIILLLVSIRFS